MSRLTEEEKIAREEAKKAQREAKKAAKAAERTEASVARVREFEKQTKEANNAANEARKQQTHTIAERKQEVAEQALSAEERRNKEVEHMHDFYDYSLDKSGKNINIDLNNYKIIQLLQRMGFYRYDQPDGSSEYVRIKHNRISLVRDTEEIVDVFEDYVRELPDRDVVCQYTIAEQTASVEKTIYSRMILEKVYKNINYYFSQTLPRLRPRKDSYISEITTVHDTPDAKYFFYNNVVLRVTKNGVEEIEYSDLKDRMEELGEDNGKYIWESNILNRDYYNIPGVGDFETFITLICGSDSMPTNLFGERYKAMQSIIGYLIHDSYECNLKAIVLTDSTQDDGMPTGGTGKGILGKAIGKILNREDADRKYIALPGKDFDTSKDTRYGLGDITTQTIHIEDAKKEIDVEALYNDITDGAVFRKLHHDPTYHRAKFIISTNTPIANVSESNKRRMCIFELDNYFSSRRTPEDVFEHRFFESKWDKHEWLLFDNFMVRCALTYMQNGLIEPGELNYSDNYLKQHLRNEFLTWIKDKLKTGISMHTQNTYELEKDLYLKFVAKYPDVFKTRNGFTSSLKTYLRTKKIPSCITRANPDILVLYPNKDTTVSDSIYK